MGRSGVSQENGSLPRAVQAQGFTTAHCVPRLQHLPGAVSNRVIDEVRGSKRVVFDACRKPAATIE